MTNYAQLDENRIVVGLSQLNDIIDAPNMILLKDYDTALIGKLYENGRFIELKYYAKLDDKDIVIDIVSYKADVTVNDENLILISQEDLNSAIGCKYESGELLKLDDISYRLEKIESILLQLTKQK